jgi:CheY-like chemotaxis protein
LVYAVSATIGVRPPKTFSRSRIIAVASRPSMKGDRERCLEAGMDNYINKPIDAVKFLEIVELTAAPSRV